MARIVSGPYVSGRVTAKQTGTPISGVTVTVSPAVYTDAEMTSTTTTLTTDGAGVFVCYALPGNYTFTTAAVDAAPIEPVEILGAEGLGADRAAGVVVAGDIGGTPTAPTVPRARFYVADNGLFISTSGSDSNDGLSPGAALATLPAAAAKIFPAPATVNNAAHRGYLINFMPGDYDWSGLSPIVINKAANLELRGVGGHGKSRTLGKGAVNIYTPPGQVGLTIGYRDNTDSAWLNDHRGVILRDLNFTLTDTVVDGGDPGSSTGLKIIGLSNCSFYNVNVANYSGTSSKGMWVQSASVANGGSGGGTNYGSMYDCSFNKSTIGLYLDHQSAQLFGCYVDGNDDLVTGYLAGSTGIFCNVGDFVAHDLVIQGVQTAVDASFAHSAGVLHQITISGLHMEACATGINSNQSPTSILGGTFDNGNLSGGAGGTTAMVLGSGATFVITGFEIGGVGTRYTVDAAASGWVRDSKGLQVYGTGAGRGLPAYQGATPSGAVLGPAGTGAAFGSFAPGSTDMSGAFTFTTGTTTSSGAVVTITFHDAYPAGTVPIVYAVVSSTGTQNNTVIRATGNANNLWQLFAGGALTASTSYTVQYAVLGTHT